MFNSGLKVTTLEDYLNIAEMHEDKNESHIMQASNYFCGCRKNEETKLYLLMVHKYNWMSLMEETIFKEVKMIVLNTLKH